MRKFSAILSLIISLVLMAAGVLVAWLEPLATLLPDTEFAVVAAPAAVATGTDLTLTAPYEAKASTFKAAELPAFEAPEGSYMKANASSSSVSSEYLFSYSFGADFYTEIYKASYKIFNQLLNMSGTLSDISSAVADNYKAQVNTLFAVENAAGTLADLGTVLSRQYEAQTETMSVLQSTNEGLATISAQVNELAAAQTTALKPVTASLSGIYSALVVIIRLMGVMIGMVGLVMLCRSLWKLGEAFEKKPAPAQEKPVETKLETTEA
ncbi:MAG: hypothetical protein Q4B32_08075 [Clostridia bacterium]|nr:hypothetical protein [Clostridia bacterium]